MESDIEKMLVDLYRLDDEGDVTVFQLPFRIAMTTYLNAIGVINEDLSSDYTLPVTLLKMEPSPDNAAAFSNLTLKQDQIFFLMTNGLRELRTQSEVSAEYQYSNSFNHNEATSLQIITIVALHVTGILAVVVFYQMWKVESLERSILSLYAYLKVAEI